MYFVGKEDIYMRDGLHLCGNCTAVFSENLLRSTDSGTGCNYYQFDWLNSQVLNATVLVVILNLFKSVSLLVCSEISKLFEKL